MSQHIYTPPEPLRTHVNALSVIEETPQAFNGRLVLPEPYPGVLFNFGAPLTWHRDDGSLTELPPVFFSGIRARPLTIRASGPVRVLGFNVFAWGARALAGDTIDLAANPFIALGGSWLRLAGALRLALVRRGDGEAVAVLADFMSGFVRGPRANPGPIRAAVEQLHATGGQSSVAALARRAYLSASQLERQSRYFAGLPPKTLSRLIRFEEACAVLIGQPARRMTDEVHRLGYADQAHFIRDFRAFAARPPREAVPAMRLMAADAEIVQFF